MSPTDPIVVIPVQPIDHWPARIGVVALSVVLILSVIGTTYLSLAKDPEPPLLAGIAGMAAGTLSGLIGKGNPPQGSKG